MELSRSFLAGLRHVRRNFLLPLKAVVWMQPTTRHDEYVGSGPIFFRIRRQGRLQLGKGLSPRHPSPPKAIEDGMFWKFVFFVAI